MKRKISVNTWRRQQRADLIARRLALPAEAQRRDDQRIGHLLEAGFPMLARLTIGFYWPFNGEVDPRVVVHRFRARGARTALPVVVQKRAPLQFRHWAPGVETVPGVFGLPVPQSPVLVPDVLLMPPVGFDGHAYRLGYGGGYFDRTLAGLMPQPLKIGLARELSRIETIHPQHHDVPMDFVITEAGIHAAGPEGLRLEDDLLAVPARVEEILAARRLLGEAELATLLNTLLEAERAGAKVVAAFASELSIEPDARERLLRVQRDEARNCASLLGLLREIGATPSRATGGFLQAALAIEGDRERLAFLNRGQDWVARRIAAALPRIADPRIRDTLRAMHESHLANIDVCRRVIVDELAIGAD
jgi:5,10-methenyltetrahydrofolate synthetase